MVTKELVDYVRNTLIKGYSEDQIRQVLLQRKYKKQDIEDALNEATMPLASHKESNAYFLKLKSVLFSPSQFFESVSEEQGFLHSIKFLVLTVLLSSVLLSISFVIALLVIPSFAFIGALFGVLLPGAFASLLILQALFIFVFFAIFGSLVLPLFLFIAAGILHLFVKLFRGQGNYVETYKVIAYSSAPMLPGIIISFIPIVGSLAVSIWQIILLVIGISSLHQISKGKAFLVWLTPFLLMVFVGILAAFLMSSSQLQFTPTTFMQPAITPPAP